MTSAIKRIFETLDGLYFESSSAFEDALSLARRPYRAELPPTADVQSIYEKGVASGWVTSKGNTITVRMPRTDLMVELFESLDGKTYASWKAVKEDLTPVFLTMAHKFSPGGLEGLYDIAASRRWIQQIDGGIRVNLNPPRLPSDAEKAIAAALVAVEMEGDDGRLTLAMSHLRRAQEQVKDFYRLK